MFKFIRISVIGLSSFSCCAYSMGLIDSLRDETKWTIENGANLGTFSLTNDGLALTRRPTQTIGDIAIFRDYVTPVANNTWFHVFVRQPDGGLLGADMYTSIFINPGSNISSESNNKSFEFNVNGEEHWHSVNGKCTPKIVDDSFHIGLAADNREYVNNEKNSLFWTNDVPVKLPVDTTYKQWILYSAKYYVPEDEVPRWRLYVNGKEIQYRDIGYRTPEGTFQNVSTVKPLAGENIIRFRFAILGDGDLYSQERAYQGAIQKQCFSDQSPFLVDQNNNVSLKEATVEWGGIMISDGAAHSFDLNTVKSYIYSGKLLTSSAVVTEMISWQNAEFNCNYISYDEIAFVRLKRPEASNFCRARVINDIYSGHISTSNAILANIINWNDAQFNCQYMSDAEKILVRNSVPNASKFCTDI